MAVRVLRILILINNQCLKELQLLSRTVRGMHHVAILKQSNILTIKEINYRLNNQYGAHCAQETKESGAMNKQIEELAMKDQTVSRWRQYMLNGTCSYTQALEGMVLQLAGEKETFFEMLVQVQMNSRVPMICPELERQANKVARETGIAPRFFIKKACTPGKSVPDKVFIESVPSHSGPSWIEKQLDAQKD